MTQNERFHQLEDCKITMDSPEKEITAKAVLSPVFPQPDGTVNDIDKSFAVIGSNDRYRRAICSTSEDGVYSSYESLERNCDSGRKRRKTTGNRVEKIPYEQKVAGKHDELVQCVTIPDNKDDPLPSAYRDWLLLKLENLQERLDEGLQKFMDEADGGHSPCMHLDPPAMSQSDLHTMNNQSFLKSSPNCSMELDRQRLDSPPALSSRASISPVPSSVSTPRVSSKHSPIIKRAQNTESEKTSSESQCLPNFRRVDRHWNTTEQKFITMEPAAEPGHRDTTKAEDYIFVVQRDFNCDKTPIKTTVEIRDILLKQCLQNIMGNISGVNFAEESPVLDPKTLFL